MRKFFNQNRYEGFSLIEVMIGLTILGAAIFGLMKYLAKSGQKVENTKQTSVLERALMSDSLVLRAYRLDDLKTASFEAVARGHKCDNSSRPTSPNRPERFLYAWRRLNSLYEYCIDIEAFELKANSSLLDIRLRALKRKFQSGSGEYEKIYFTMRKGLM